MLRMILQSGVEDFLNFLMRGEKLGNLAPITVVLQHADGKGFGTAKNQPTLEWRENRARRFLYEGKLIGLILPCANYDAAYSVAVTV